jgi:Family of unknown function (DUF6065)
MSEQGTDDTLQIYRVPSKSGYPQIVPASPDRDWMNITTRGWANRCLPLRIANEAGWFILNDSEFEVEWDGELGMNCLHFSFPQPPMGMIPFNMVGYGIVSWVPPYLFRTPDGINLWVRGPANTPKDGITALEGLVETDWLPYTFTINWKITRPGVKIRFDKGEPICFLTPVRRFEAERLQPILHNIASDPDLEAQYNQWHERRLRAKAISGEDGALGKFAVPDQGHYIRGETAKGIRVTEHQAKLHVKPVREAELPPIATDEEKPLDQSQSSHLAVETDTVLEAYNGTVHLTEQDVIITRRVGWRGRLFGKKAPTMQIPLKGIKCIQLQENATLMQMAFIRFVIGDAPTELHYVAACRDPYTLLVDKPQISALQGFSRQLNERLAVVRPGRG